MLGFATCSGAAPTVGCPTPVPGSDEANLLAQARSSTDFTLVYPCYLPNTEHLTSQSVTGTTGRQSSELVFSGPYDMTVRQSQSAPPVSPDPSGASHVSLTLFTNVPATLIEVYDGSSKALYHLFWEQNDLFYELQVYGPPQERDTVLKMARSLQ